MNSQSDTRRSGPVRKKAWWRPPDRRFSRASGEDAPVEARKVGFSVWMRGHGLRSRTRSRSPRGPAPRRARAARPRRAKGTLHRGVQPQRGRRIKGLPAPIRAGVPESAGSGGDPGQPGARGAPGSWSVRCASGRSGSVRCSSIEAWTLPFATRSGVLRGHAASHPGAASGSRRVLLADDFTGLSLDGPLAVCAG